MLLTTNIRKRIYILNIIKVKITYENQAKTVR